MAVDMTINLSANGGDAVASEVAKTKQALDSITTSSSQMESQFQHRFQHMGLMLFAGDALRASGLGRETRDVVSLLNTAIMAGGSAFGAAAGPVMLFASALVAIIGAAKTVIDHNKDLVVTLEKQNKSTQDSIKSIDEEITSLHKLDEATGGLTRSQEALLRSDEKLRAAHIQNEQESNKALIAALNMTLVKDKETLATLRQTQAEIQARSSWIGASREMKRVTDDIAAATLKLDSDERTLNQTINRQIDLHRGVTQSIKEQADAADQSVKKEEKDAKEISDAIEAELKRRQEAFEKSQKSLDELHDNALKQEDARIKKQMESVKHAADYMGSQFGGMFARMIVEGKKFNEEFQNVMKHMAEMFIEKVITMIIEWVALRAVMSIMPGGAAAYQATAMAAYPGLAQQSYGELDYGGEQATGGTYLVNRPTMFVAGESGPEIASFTPAGSNTSSGGGTTVNINLSVDHIQGNDPAGTLDLLSQEIRRETIAGRRFASTVSGVSGRYPNQAY